MYQIKDITFHLMAYCDNYLLHIICNTHYLCQTVTSKLVLNEKKQNQKKKRIL